MIFIFRIISWPGPTHESWVTQHQELQSWAGSAERFHAALALSDPWKLEMERCTDCSEV